RIRQVIPDLVQVAGLEDIARDKQASESGPTYVLFTTPKGDQGFIDRLIDIAGRYRQQFFFIIISDDIAASDYKRLVASGGADWVSAANAANEIVDIITRRSIAAEGKRSGGLDEPLAVAFVPSA